MNLISIIFSSIREGFKNTNDVKNLKNKIIPYSLMKIKANTPLPYSILNPETISDSPSDVSKGVRLDSAKHSVIHTINKGSNHSMKGNELDKNEMVCKL